MWDEDGRRRTGIVEGELLRVEDCAPPEDERATRAPSATRAWGDISLHGMVGPNRLGAANAAQVAPDPGMTVAITAAVRKHFGRLRLGPIVGARLSDAGGYRALAVGGAAAWRLPSLHPRLDTEVSAELAAERIAVDALRSMSAGGGAAKLAFWAPLPALQLTGAVALSPNLEALIAARLDGVPARDVDRDVVYCDFGCLPAVRETWRIGGVSYGLVLGLRLVVR